MMKELEWTKDSQELLVYFYHLYLTPAKGVNLIACQQIAAAINQQCATNFSPSDCRTKILSLINEIHTNSEESKITMKKLRNSPYRPGLIQIVEDEDDEAVNEGEFDTPHECTDLVVSESSLEESASEEGYVTSIAQSLNEGSSIQCSIIGPLISIKQGTDSNSTNDSTDSSKLTVRWSKEMESYLVKLIDQQMVGSSKRNCVDWELTVRKIEKKFKVGWVSELRCQRKWKRYKEKERTKLKNIQRETDEEELFESPDDDSGRRAIKKKQTHQNVVRKRGRPRKSEKL